VIGSAVKRLKGAGCTYQSEDGKTDVSILISGAGSGDKLLEEMRETARAHPDVKVERSGGSGSGRTSAARPVRRPPLQRAGEKLIGSTSPQSEGARSTASPR
jgi:hypothetical protein